MEVHTTAVNFKNRVLILGDGNFSFSLSFAQHSLGLMKNEGEPILKSSSPRKENIYLPVPSTLGREKGNIVANSSLILYATSYDSKEVVAEDEESSRNIDSLNEFENVVVLHNVDATDLRRTFNDSVKFNKVIFNFPHVGGKSNISACRKLLENSFRSISDVIDGDSEVLITLCRGQGGTPVDVRRNGYGNSWQIVTQAAKSGLVLSNIIGFDIVAPPGYVTAGYRGMLKNGFIKKEALTHIFKKGIEFSLPVEGNMRFLSRKMLIKKVDRFYLDGLGSFNPFTSIRHTFSQCSSRLKSIFEAGYKPTSYQASHSVERSGEPYLLSAVSSQQMSHITTFDDWRPMEILMEAKSKSEIRCTSQIFVSSAINISPLCYPVYEEFVFLDGTLRFPTLKEFISSLKLSFQLAFEGCLLEISWNTEKICENEGCKVTDNKGGAFDVALVPNFLHSIPMDSWLNLEPDVTISRNINDVELKSVQKNSEQTSSVQYTKIAFGNYTMSRRELKYFARDEQELSFRCCFDNDWPICTLKVNGVVVGEAGIFNTKKEMQTTVGRNLDYMAVFRTDLLSLALLQINDIRLFWSMDGSYQERLRQCMVNFGSKCNLPSRQVMYPLCYRHDLCFWVKEAESEDILLAAIRHCCHDIVHSVKLLRILRHEESDLLSFCYRLIYSRCDGPLSKKESVELQNRLRLFLIDLNFDLR